MINPLRWLMSITTTTGGNKMTTTESPVMQLHDLTGVQFHKAVVDIIIATIASEVCDDAITEIVKEAISDESIMTEVEQKIESAIEDLELENKIESAIEDIDFSDKINEAIDENDAFDLDEKVRVAMVTQLGDTPTITEVRRDIHDLKMECNSLREHNKKSLDMTVSLLELIRAINNK